MKESLKVGVSGVRGVVGESFTPQLAATFAQAFGAFVGRGPVVVGRDTRPSGTMLEQAVIAGLQSVGCTPLRLGIVPTPTLLLATKELGARGGIAITASHNAAEWNALKFVNRAGLFLDETRAGELYDLYHQGEFPLVPEAELPGVATALDPFARHAARIASYVDTGAIQARRFKVAVDCVNGVGALFTPAWLREALGCEVVALHDQPTGFFERGRLERFDLAGGRGEKEEGIFRKLREKRRQHRGQHLEDSRTRPGINVRHKAKRGFCRAAGKRNAVGKRQRRSPGMNAAPGGIDSPPVGGHQICRDDDGIHRPEFFLDHGLILSSLRKSVIA